MGHASLIQLGPMERMGTQKDTDKSTHGVNDIEGHKGQPRET